MKKIISLMLITVLMATALAGCKKTKTETPTVEEKPPVSEEIKKEEVKEEKKEEKTEEPLNAEELQDKGMFLGMDDSNFVVIFSSSEKKDVHYKIAPSLNFKDSDIELGEAVSYRYTVSKTDEKTITYIEAVKTE